ncbi:hypothetical protein PR002_g7822 [Phytophthora rubi]|uniref:Uncharacterized protein n=1 Tax=Phytophthora rubi TaxID=129364 RepID=A0A6A3N0X0_9STRA|nr:hypothetical protein PR002_g7822 [Phytophthora rubi]
MVSPAPASQERVRVSPYLERCRSPVSNEVYAPITLSIYRLIVQPIVKGTATERDTSGTALDPFIAAGASFQGILEKLWEQFSSQVKGRTVKANESWTIEAASRESWVKFMVFKVRSTSSIALSQRRTGTPGYI